MRTEPSFCRRHGVVGSDRVRCPYSKLAWRLAGFLRRGPVTYRNEERGRAKQMKELVKMGINNKNERDDEKPLYCLPLIHCRKVLYTIAPARPSPPRSQHGSLGMLSCSPRPRTKLCGAVPPFGRSPSARGFRSSTCFGFLLHSFFLCSGLDSHGQVQGLTCGVPIPSVILAAPSVPRPSGVLSRGGRRCATMPLLLNQQH